MEEDGGGSGRGALGGAGAVGTELEAAMRRVLTIVTSAQRSKLEKRQASVLTRAAEASRQEVDALELRLREFCFPVNDEAEPVREHLPELLLGSRGILASEVLFRLHRLRIRVR